MVQQERATLHELIAEHSAERRNLEFFERLRIEAQKSLERNKHAALIIGRDMRVIGVGRNDNGHTNSFLWLPYFQKFKCTTHAEIHALMDAVRNLPMKDAARILRGNDPRIFRGAILYSYRETKTGKIANARPCPKICEPILLMLGFAGAYYTMPYEPYIRYVSF
jgi:tRNA(Arg) A34 adenosine deaminase TadA